MPPEVSLLASALLFVVGSGVVYRFCSWLLRRSAVRQPSAIVAPKTDYAPPAETPAPLAVSTPPFRTPVAGLQRPSPPPSAPANVPMPAPTLHHTVTVAVEATAPVAATDAPALRPALKPSIAATLPPKQSASPAPLAVSTPPFRTPVANVRRAASLPSAPPNVPMPAPARHYAAPVAAVPTATVAKDDAPPADAVASEPVSHDETAAEPILAPSASEDLAPEPIVTAPPSFRTTAQRSFVLRAWKLGEVAPRLDIRLKESRRRKVITLPKVLRKPSEKLSARGLKVLAPRSEPDKTPVRRIGRKVAEAILASAQAQTRVVGVVPRRYRILPTTEL